MRIKLSRERWAQVGITVQFLALVRTLAEFFRLRYTLGDSFTVDTGAAFVEGGLIASSFCWAAVALYFFRRYATAAMISAASVVVLLAYKLMVLGC